MADRYQWKKIRDEELAQAKRLEEITSKLTKGYTDINKHVIDFSKAIKVSTDKINIQHSKERMNSANNRAAEQRLHDMHKLKILEMKQQLDDLKIVTNDRQQFARAERLAREKAAKDDRIARTAELDARNKNRIDVEKVHGENVRYNLRMRALYRDQGQSFSNVMNMMGGSTFGGAAVGGANQLFGAVSKGSGILADTKALREAQQDLALYKATSLNDPSIMRTKQDRVDRLTEILKQTRERMGIWGFMGGSGTEGSTISKKLEPLVEWAKRHKTGIILSAASIGLMFMTFKKLLSVSPMLQKMLEIMGLSFNLILRPFGDFIGFVLRPIAMMMLSTVMPFFKSAYPFLMKLGSAMGEKFAKGDILGGLGLMFEAITPIDVLRWIFGDREGNTAGAVGAGGAALSAGVIGGGVLGTYGTIKTGQYLVNKITGSGNKQGISGTYNQAVNQGGRTGKSPNIFNAASQKIFAALGKGAAAKGAMMAAARAMTAFKLTNPIGWAFLGWEGITSAIKHFSPETYQGMRDATEFLGIGREFIGLGEKSLFEHGLGVADWLTGGSNENVANINTGLVPTPEDGLGVNPNYNPQYREPSIWDTNQRKLPIQITFNIDKVEKGVDVNMIALQVKSILETSNTRLLS